MSVWRVPPFQRAAIDGSIWVSGSDFDAARAGAGYVPALWSSKDGTA
ncbi:MAG: hypothetical protein IIC71_10075 [Acidobacteria bacterium]|nr:hypothetical protein [Acidobacteriota bacterium]